MPELILLGSGTGIPSLKRGPPGLILISESSTVLIDSGSGILRRMLEVGTTYRDIDLLLYTHIHPDHISELVPILFACRYADLPRQKDLIVVGGPGFKDYFNQLKKLYIELNLKMGGRLLSLEIPTIVRILLISPLKSTSWYSNVLSLMEKRSKDI